MSRARMLLALAALTLAAVAAPAVAEDDHAATLNAAKPVFEWDGATDVGTNIAYSSELPCDVTLPVTACEEALLNVDVPSGDGITLTVELDEAGDEDFDLYVYKSDADGAVGDELGVSDNAAPAAEKVTVPSAKGFYLVRVVYYQNVETSYHGKASVSGLPAPPAEAPAAAAGPAPAPSGSGQPPPPPSGTPAPAPAAAPGPAPTATPRPADLTANLTLRRTRVRSARRSGLSVRLTCSDSCNAILRARIDARTARRLGLGRRARTIGTSVLQISPDLGRRYRLQLDSSARRKLRRGTRIRVSARVTDTDGRRALTVADRVTLRR